MNDREKVIKGVHDARRYLEDREWVDKSVGVHIDALNDALDLLKEQEAKSVVTTTTEFLGVPMVTHHNCPKCGKGLYGASGQTNYCSFCGQAVKWE